jgi:protein-S-isoprenylcysteine O-methyltransferase Ste14
MAGFAAATRVPWFDDRSLTSQWRFAQAVLAIPVFFFVVGLLMLGLQAMADPGDAWVVLQSRAARPWAIVPVALAVAAILWIDRHLAAGQKAI